MAKPNGPQPIDGISLKPVLKDSSIKNKDHIYQAYDRQGNMGEAFRTERYRMVIWTNMKDESEVVYELYDHEIDPNEKVKIAKQKPEIIKELLKMLNSYPTAKGL